MANQDTSQNAVAPSSNPKEIALFIEMASVNWVGTIQNAQSVTASLNNILAQKLMSLYSAENASLDGYLSKLSKDMKSMSGSELTNNINQISMEMNVAQKEWDNAINTQQTTTQQLSSQMQAQGNDAQQATTSAGLMANLLQASL